MPALMAFGPYGSAVPGETTMPVAPKAYAAPHESPHVPGIAHTLQIQAETAVQIEVRQAPRRLAGCEDHIRRAAQRAGMAHGLLGTDPDVQTLRPAPARPVQRQLRPRRLALTSTSPISTPASTAMRSRSSPSPTSRPRSRRCFFFCSLQASLTLWLCRPSMSRITARSPGGARRARAPSLPKVLLWPGPPSGQRPRARARRDRQASCGRCRSWPL